MRLDDLKLGLTAIFEPAPEGGFTSSFAEFPEVFSEGDTMDEARENLLDALQEVLAFHRDEARARQGANAVRETLQLALTA